MISASTPDASTAAASSGRQRGEELIDEQVAEARFSSLKTRVWIQTWIMAGLGLLLVLVVPFAQPVNFYYAMDPDKKLLQMVGLEMPNMTNRAVLSWATTSITEIMTMGFGDMDVRLPEQKWRFTKDGWNAYVKAFVRQKIGEKFKQSQLVLTTAPSNTPVIIWQGVNDDQVYQWIVQMPVIMTYATNNNVTEKKTAIVTLTIVRVPAEDSAAGIAIDGWELGA